MDRACGKGGCVATLSSVTKWRFRRFWPNPATKLEGKTEQGVHGTAQPSGGFVSLGICLVEALLNQSELECFFCKAFARRYTRFPPRGCSG